MESKDQKNCDKNKPTISLNILSTKKNKEETKRFQNIIQSAIRKEVFLMIAEDRKRHYFEVKNYLD